MSSPSARQSTPSPAQARSAAWRLLTHTLAGLTGGLEELCLDLCNEGWGWHRGQGTAPRAWLPPESPLGHGWWRRAGGGPGQAPRCPLGPAGHMLPVSGHAVPRQVPGRARASACREPGCGSRAEAEPLVLPRHTWMLQLHIPQAPHLRGAAGAREGPALPSPSILVPRSAWTYHRHSPARRGSRPRASSCPPPAGRSWCHTGRSGSPGAGRGAEGMCPQAQPHRRLPFPSGEAPQPPRTPSPAVTSSQFCSSFTQNLARWKLLLSVRSEGEG